MRITITPINVTASATPFVLGDDTMPQVNGPTSALQNGATGEVLDGFLPELSVATQRDELINAPYAKESPRGNLQLTYSWKTLRVHDTPDNAAMFLADHPMLIPIVGTLTVYIGTAPTQRVLHNAVLKSLKATEHSGRSTTFAYTYSGSFLPPIYGAAGSGTGGPFTTS
jgi:hypothetical protein